MILRGVGTFSSLLTSIFISRFFGAGGIAHFTIFMTWQNFLSELLFGGFKNFTIRSVATQNFTKFNSSRQYNVLIISLLIMFFGFALFFIFKIFKVIIVFYFPSEILDSLIYQNTENISLYIIISSTCLSIIRLCSSAIKGLMHSFIGTFTENILLPVLFFLFITTLIFLKSSFSYNLLLSSYIISIITVSIFSFMIWKIFSKPSIKLYFKFSDLVVLKNPSVLKLYFSDILNRIFALLPLVILPFYVSNIEVGQFTIASKLAFISNMILVTISTYFNPYFAKYFEIKDISKLRFFFSKSQLFCMMFYLPVFITYLIFGDNLILLFGNDLHMSKNYLLLLSLGQLLSAYFGLSGQLLFMVNKEYYYLHINIISIISCVFISIIFCPYFGVFGIVFALIIYNFFKNLCFYIYVKREILCFG